MYCHPTMFDGMADRLFRNNGNGTFTDVSKAAGIANPAGKGLGVAFCDFDRDGDTDIYVANDMVRNFLYRNNGNGTFVDVAYAAGVGFDGNGKPQAGMGVDCGDVDGNGFPDLFVTNFSEELNTLYSNLGEGLFEDVTQKAGLGSGFVPLGFGTKMFDVDNDGDLDIHVTNGHVIDNVKLYQPNLTYAQKDLLYENIGGRFRDVTAQSGPALQAERVGRGLAVADFDNDGNLDVVISSVGRAPVLLAEPGAPATATGSSSGAQGTKSNRFGLGATVRIQTADGLQVREINNVASYLSANDIRLHVGLGSAKIVQQIEVLWPSGTKQIAEGRRRQPDSGHQGTVRHYPLLRPLVLLIGAAGAASGADGDHAGAARARSGRHGARECLSREQHRRHAPRAVRFRAAAAEFRRALEADPNLAIARLNLGIALFYASDPDAAEREIVAAKPDLPDGTPARLHARPHRPRHRTNGRGDRSLHARAASRPGTTRERPSIWDSSTARSASIRRRSRRFAARWTSRPTTRPRRTAWRTRSFSPAGRRRPRGDGALRALSASSYAITYSQTYLEQGRYAEAIASTGAEPQLVNTAIPTSASRMRRRCSAAAERPRANAARAASRSSISTATAISISSRAARAACARSGTAPAGSRT